MLVLSDCQNTTDAISQDLNRLLRKNLQGECILVYSYKRDYVDAVSQKGEPVKSKQ
jgi:uncharacterized protein YheU (UPF0270 family)